MKKSYLTWTDQFCGAGGSSQGVRNLSNKMGGGLEVALALNHWDLAIETHNTNFQETLHDCTDISACDPRRYPSTDFLITSPECTNQTGANGKKKPTIQLDIFDQKKLCPAEERSRATMWDVVRFAEYHQYNCITVENVVEARKWVMFEAWLNAMHVLGYRHKCLYLNSMHFFPCPQSRDRMYIVFWKKGNKAPELNYTPLAYCQCCGKDVKAVQSWKPNQKTFKYKTGYVYCCPYDGNIVDPYYHAAFNCIDWSIPGRRIGDIDLVDNTIRRIKLGREKYWKDGQQTYQYPLIIKGEYTKTEGYVRKAVDAFQTQSTRQTFGLLTPMIVEYNRTGKAFPVTDNPITTFTGAERHGLVMPYIIENKGKSTAREISKPLSCITTMLQHGIVTSEAFNAFITYYNGGSDVSSHILSPAGVFSSNPRHGLVINKAPEIEDCFYRTLKAHEIKLGMAFDADYIIKGNSKDQVKQCGNAVTPPVMEWIQGQLVNSLN
ncbi:DNA (cytosine-5-)-methyltransferase [Sphingobacterium spiritivorum]|uniref:DNA (cytosine-5-)-methyltransferase n=1 Tax=Sphingobacterium spiritivorum TaxID=258 RepID=A0A380CQ55_SPHSI|nr:DNA cytosine methyltransferase [Sphingobacterium spiritivorum]SUJ26387.1 DNA (cytosine-5-)-methyltransferase [Sphingobacterium spiritivorum]